MPYPVRRRSRPHSYNSILLVLAFAVLLSPAMAKWDALGGVKTVGPGITPGICIDASGAVHIVSMHDGKIQYRRGTSAGVFGEPEEIPAPEGPARYNSPHLVCDAKGTIHLVFERDFTKRSQKAWYTNRQEGKWRKPVVALDHSGTERRINYPRLAVSDTAVYVAGFAGGGSTVAKIVNLHSNPTVSHTVDTPLWVAHPLTTGRGLAVVGRDSSRGHKIEHYSADLELRVERQLVSHGTPTKTFEPTAAITDEKGIIHVAGATQIPTAVLWYTTDKRAAAGKNVILGPELGTNISEFTYPVLLRDARRRIYVSYRDNTTGESRLTVLEHGSEKFEKPIVVSPSITRRLRWNAHLAAAPRGGAHVVWDADGQIHHRTVGEAAR